MIDSRDINLLHPTLKRGAEELSKRLLELGYPLGISSTYRDNEAQDALYAQGRTTSGSIVTNAKGGQSIHNYKLAFDVFKNISGEAYSDATFFETAGKIWTEMGGEWGGSWTSFPDKPHMQFTGGLTLSQLQNGYSLDEKSTMSWENNSVISSETSEKEKEESEMDKTIYNSIEDVPSWATSTIEKLVNKKYLSGTGEGLNLTEDMIRIFVIHDNAGLYDL